MFLKPDFKCTLVYFLADKINWELNSEDSPDSIIIRQLKKAGKKNERKIFNLYSVDYVIEFEKNSL